MALAEATVIAAASKLPPELQEAAQAVPVLYHERPSPEILGNEFDPDILGLFVGSVHGQELSEAIPSPTHILLFLENLWDFAESDPAIFQEEVRITYLHELGHYLGWDEDDLELRGLD